MNKVFAGIVVAVLVVAFQVQAELKVNPMDADKDGKVSREEFCSAQAKRAKRDGREFNIKSVEKQFSNRDKDSDGFLTGDELIPPSKKAKPAAE